MPISQTHIDLVESLKKWIAKQYLNGATGSLLVDQPGSSLNTTPPPVDSYIPDAYLHSSIAGILIVGEAKTSNDLETKHSISQITSFINECGNNDSSLFVLIVPWDCTARASNLVKFIKKRNDLIDVSTSVISPLSN